MLLEPRGKERERGRVGERGDEIDLIGPDTDHNFMLSKTEMVTAWTGGYKGTTTTHHTTTCAWSTVYLRYQKREEMIII